MEGWIKLHRRLLEWEWYDDTNTFRLFIHLILKANHKDKKYRGQIVKAGTLLTGRELLSIETGLTVSQIRTSLNKLKMTNELTIKSTAQGTEIVIVNYLKYQVVTNEFANESPTNRQRIATNKNVKNEKNIKQRIQDFGDSLNSFVDIYGRDMVKEFFLYWTEPNKSGSKFRAELQKTWSTERRLQTWSRNNFNGSYKPKEVESIEDREQRLMKEKQN